MSLGLQTNRGVFVMLLLEINNIQKFFADRLLLKIKNFKVYSGDRIGLVGANGSGKTTLLNVISGHAEPDAGNIRRLGGISYIKQVMGESLLANEDVDGYFLSQFKVSEKISQKSVSGGEDMRIRIAQALSESPRLLLVDEPTSNLDEEGLFVFEKFFEKIDTFILVSHDRLILDKFCNKIITLKNGDIVSYNCGYQEYLKIVQDELENEREDYEKYVAEKSRLTKAHQKMQAKAKK